MYGRHPRRQACSRATSQYSACSGVGSSGQIFSNSGALAGSGKLSVRYSFATTRNMSKISPDGGLTPIALTRTSLSNLSGCIVAISAASQPPNEKPIRAVFSMPMSSIAMRYHPARSRMFMIQSRYGESPKPGWEGMVSAKSRESASCQRIRPGCPISSCSASSGAPPLPPLTT